MDPIETAVIILYFAVLAVLGLYGVHRYFIAWLWRRTRDLDHVPPKIYADDELPWVTVQLPVYNELYVVERLIDAVCQMDYPLDRFEVQVLDDSRDESVEVAAAAIARWQKRGVDVVHVRRSDRTGFKAGALEHGAGLAKGEFLAVFDADFIPNADFLRRTVHHFSDPGVGMVQARWDHLNRDFSGLTQAQSILLDGHFVLEHAARNRSGRYFNFNGTAGIWRRLAIADAGGWQHDTLTEDLDLSYRSQLAGWRFVFLPDVLAPAELPPDMNSFKSQQHRWAKGSIQTARKLLGALLRSKAPLKVKAEAFVHLTNNLAYVLMVLLAILMPYAMVIRVDHGWTEFVLLDLPLFGAATISVCSFYVLSQAVACTATHEQVPRGLLLRRLIWIPLTLAIGIGMSINQARAVIEALIGAESPFVRTPKFAVTRRGDDWRSNRYLFKADLQAWIEVAFGLSFVYPTVVAVQNGLWFSLPFTTLFAYGYLYVGLASITQSRSVRRVRRRGQDATAATA
jgi:cellulose synthase/poly-beta-1,6-N-acetylglucosamine synthase-like glycosyltransferase